jgi:hypothetical protein
MDKERFTILLQKFMDQSLSDPERSELSTVLNKKQYKELITGILEEMLSQPSEAGAFDEKRHMPLIAGILSADTIEAEKNESSNPALGGRSLFRRIGVKIGLWQ